MTNCLSWVILYSSGIDTVNLDTEPTGDREIFPVLIINTAI